MPRGLVPVAALLPLRAFLGVTFVYAGLDKLTSSTFFNDAAPGSIHAQLEAFTRVSPIAGLVQPFVPLAGPVGLVIAVTEIAIGLGALSGLVFRLAAAGGAALSLLFWLTASWATHPYYYGPDLPYAMGWVTLALAGTGEVLVLWPWLRRQLGPVAPAAGGHAESGPDRNRRLVLQAGVLAAASIALAALAGISRPFLGGDDGGAGPLASTVPGGAGAPSGSLSAAGSTPAPGAGSAAPAAGSSQIATVSQLQPNASIEFTVPPSNNPNVPSGDPGVLIQLADGKVVAYDAVCTHAGCTVAYDPQFRILACPCHGAEFDPAKNAEVVAGPAPAPLASLPITIDKATGAISISA